MDVFDEEIIKFFHALYQNDVRYILVGDYAVNLHGFNRFSDILNIWLKDTADNRRNLRRAFIDCAIGDFPMIETMQFVPGWTEFYLNNSLRLDIMTNMKGLEDHTFEQCLEIAAVAELSGAQIPFLHINQLIANKRKVNRPKDKIDVIALEEIRRLREEENGPDNDSELGA